MPLREGAWLLPPVGIKAPLWWRATSRFAIGTVGLFCKFWLDWLNTVRIHNREVLEAALEKRSSGQGLLTVSNHTSCIDDPLIWGILRTRQFFKRDGMRWTSGAQDICFKGDRHSRFFWTGKVFPIVRGDGVYQRGTDFTIEQLNIGNWCHYFPEGKINMTKESLRLKWGVGRIIADCQVTPIVLPIWHIGMDDILPNVKPYIPQINKKVTVVIGNPLDFAKDVKQLKSSDKNPKEIRKQIIDVIQEEFQRLRTVAETLYAQDFKSS